MRGAVADDGPRRTASAAPASPVERPVQSSVIRDQGSAPNAAVSAAPSVTATLAPPRPRASPVGIPSINVVAERWDDVIAALRENRMLLAPFLEQAVPSAISASGALTVRTDDAAAAEALETGKADMLAVLTTIFPAIDRIVIAKPEGASVTGAPRRVTEEEIRAQRIASLRKRDPVLGAAIDALDLELLD